MNRWKGAFARTIEINEGNFEYKFQVDGKWINDPENPNMRELSDLVYFASAWYGD